jgi:hypothetical protein
MASGMQSASGSGHGMRYDWETKIHHGMFLQNCIGFLDVGNLNFTKAVVTLRERGKSGPTSTV